MAKKKLTLKTEQLVLSELVPAIEFLNLKKGGVRVSKQYKFVEPEVTRLEMAKVLIKGLDRSLTEQEVKTIHWLGDTDYETRGVILDLFKELNERIQFYKEC